MTDLEGGNASGGAEDTTQPAVPVVQFPASPPAEGESQGAQANQGVVPGEDPSPHAQRHEVSKGQWGDIAMEGGVMVLSLAKGILGNFSLPGTDVAFEVALGILGNIKVMVSLEAYAFHI